MREENKNIAGRIIFPLIIVALMLLVEILGFAKGIRYTQWGIYPRDTDNLIGIITAPFIHKDIEHLFSNLFPMVMLLAIMVFFYNRIAVVSYLLITVLTGLMVWLFARPAFHIGASGVVYGLVAFVAWTGIFRRNLKSIVLALMILAVYGSYFGGIVPNEEGVSWESHLFGGLVGIFTAFVMKNVREPDEEIKKEDPFKDEEDPQYFFPRDTFEKTKMQRYLDSLTPDEEE